MQIGFRCALFMTAFVAVSFFAGVMSCFSAGRNEGEKSGLRIFLLIGQSNMAGRAPIEAEDTAPIPRCFLLNDTNEWEAAVNPLNRYSRYRKELGMQQLNPGYTFAKKLASECPDISIGLVVSARGGTKVEEWQPGEDLYEEAVRRARIARESGVLAGILWHQGEGNCDDTGYLEKIRRVIEGLRRDLEAPELPFIAGQIRMNDDWAVNAVIADLPNKIPHTAYVSAAGLTTFDDWHFDTVSMRILGERYADAFLAMTGRNLR